VYFQCAQKIVLNERIDRYVVTVAVCQRVPLRGIDRGQVVDEPDCVVCQQTLSRQSMYFSASSAAMQPLPAEVTAWR
jgi:hypothetical protein